MFESLTLWFESLRNEGKLFEHIEDEGLHVALASVLYHVINADQVVDAAEKREFDRILKQEFDLDQEQVDHLYHTARNASSDMQGDLHTVNRFLKKKPAMRMLFMRKLIQLVDVHGTHNDGLAVFYATLDELFPELKSLHQDPTQ